MKKLLTIVMTIAMVAVLTACGAQATSSGISQTKEESTEGKSEPKKEPKKVTEATIEETVLVDESGIKITAKELQYSSSRVGLDIVMENNTDQKLSFYSGTMGYAVNSINGYMISGGYVGEDIAAGMTANETMYFNLDELQLYGIADIADIAVGFQIKDEDYDEYLVTGPIEIKTSLADGYDYSKDTFAEVMQDKGLLANFDLSQIYFDATDLIGESGCKNYCQTVLKNDDGDTMLLMEVENKTEEDMYLTFGNISLNGVGVSSGNWSTQLVCAGKKAAASITLTDVLDDSTAKAFGISELKEVAFDLTGRDDGSHELWKKHIDIPFNGSASDMDETGEVLYDNNDIQLIYKNIVADDFEYSDDLHILFMVKNDSDQEITVDTGFGDIYVNKVKVSGIAFGVDVLPGQSGILDIDLMGYDLEDNDITLDSISEFSVDIEIRDDNYNEIDSTTLTKTLK